MEYFLGSVMTLFGIAFISRVLNRKEKTLREFLPHYSQSYVYSLTREAYSDFIHDVPPADSQSLKHFDKLHTRVVILDDWAYWIQNNVLLCAEFGEQGVDKNSTREVDTMGMDRVQLDKMILVVERLTKGSSNDRGHPGNKGI